MKKLSLVLIPLLLSVAVSANETKRVDSNVALTQTDASSTFQRLEDMFNAGQAPTVRHKFGKSGRCFTAAQEVAMKGAYYEAMPSSSNGPLGPETFSVLSVWNDNLSYYDNTTVAQIEASSGSAFREGALDSATQSLRVVLSADTISFAKKNGTYLIEKVAHADGTASHYCYYYIDLP